MVASCLTTAELGFGLDTGTGFDSVFSHFRGCPGAFNASCVMTGFSVCLSDDVLRATGGAFLGVGKPGEIGSGSEFILIMKS